jgi:glycosyltransferase involved in cell wall biosynthesis
MTRRAQRIYYIGMITTDAYGRAVGERVYAGAAARKMVSVGHALRSVGHQAVIVSLPFVGTKSKKPGYGPVITSEGGMPIVFLATLRSKYLRKISAPFLLAVYAWRCVERHDNVIVYNHAVEYILALFVMRAKGVRVVQDIEDVPTDGEGGVKGFLNHISFAVTSKLTERRKMVVADHVARGIGLDDFVVVRGVASLETEQTFQPNEQKWDNLRAGRALKLHFGGTLIAETGVDLFCSTVEFLANESDRLGMPVIFSVTGVGEIDKIRDLQARIHGTAKIDVEIYPELNKADYLALIDSCHASLSLKRPGSEMANTTFPSKVIEITSSGLALVSTRLGDVAEIFDTQSAFFLNGYEARNLGDVIIKMAANPELVEMTASAGMERCNAAFSPENVGHEMMRLFADP